VCVERGRRSEARVWRCMRHLGSMVSVHYAGRSYPRVVTGALWGRCSPACAPGSRCSAAQDVIGMVGFGKDFGATRCPPSAPRPPTCTPFYSNHGLVMRRGPRPMRAPMLFLQAGTLLGAADRAPDSLRRARATQRTRARSVLGGDGAASALSAIQRGMVETQKYLSSPLRPYLWFLPVRSWSV